MSSPVREAWLSLTPEPERDLPVALAALRAGGKPSAAEVEIERKRAEGLVLRGNRKRWLAWLNEGLELAEKHAGASSASRPGAPGVEGDTQLNEARELLLDVIENHHALEQGLPGRVRRPAGDCEKRLMRKVWARNGKETHHERH
jgi:hypothetical protein